MAEEPAIVQLLQKRVGLTGILLFQVYFIALGTLSAYLLWAVWPVSGAEPCQGSQCVVSLLGYPIDFAERGRDAQLFLIAAFAGILGSFLHAATSFVTYVGNRALVRSWAAWYVLRPVIGMTLGVLLFVVLRAGLVTPGSAEAVDPFGVAAVAGLAGMFSKNAIDKLKDVFNNLFSTSTDAYREDKPTDAERERAHRQRKGADPAV